MTRSGDSGQVLALSGGVGGAKLALGLALVLESDQLTVVANTGDDFTHLGLHVAPDLDTVMYTLSGLADRQRGWGLEGETWNFLGALAKLGGEDWFRLGDRDLATHVERSRRLKEGSTLSEVTANLCSALGVGVSVVPMTDDRVRTRVLTADGELSFQHYFVRDRCEPVICGFRFEGIERAAPAPLFERRLLDSSLRAVIVCPSNPWVSVDPILRVPGVEDALRDACVPRVAVSPIVGGEAIKGPAAKMMAELEIDPSALSVARWYAQRDLLDGFVLDEVDRGLRDEVEELGLVVSVCDTVMRDLDDRRRVAETCLALADRISSGNP